MVLQCREKDGPWRDVRPIVAKQQGGGADIETQAWECEMWPDWMHCIVDATMDVADRLDMSTEQAIAYAVLSSLSPSPTGGEAGAQNELGTFDRIGKQTASELLVATIKHSARIQERLRAEIERLTAERDHYRERFFLAWAALTPVSEDEKRGMARVLAILESKKKSGTGPVKGEFGLKWSGRLQAFEECREMLRLALASLPKESADA